MAVEAGPTIVHPELGERQHLVVARSLADRAPITDPPAPGCSPTTEVVNVSIDPGQVTDPDGPRRADWPPRASGGRDDRRRPDLGTARPASSRSSRCDRPTGRRSARRSSTCRVRCSPPPPRLLAPVVRFALRALLGRVGTATGRGDQGTHEGRFPSWPRETCSWLSGLQRAFQEQLGTAGGFTVTVASTNKNTATRGTRSHRSAPSGRRGADAVVRGEADAAALGRGEPTRLP